MSLDTVIDNKRLLSNVLLNNRDAVFKVPIFSI